MKNETKKLLMRYIEKYNDMKVNMEIDKEIGCDVRYDAGKIYILSDVIYDLASLLNITVNMDIKGIITIAE